MFNTQLRQLLHYGWSYNKYIIAFLRSGNMGKYSVLWFCIVPPFGRANTATLELNISPYCPPSHAIIYIYPSSLQKFTKSSDL